MNRIVWFLLAAFMTLTQGMAVCQTASKGLIIEPFVNKVFIEEKGQFKNRIERQSVAFDEPILFGVENAEFNAYFTQSGIHFRFAEYKTVPKGKRQLVENEPESRGLETTWHSVDMLWENADPEVQILFGDKLHEYYNYALNGTDETINFAAAYSEIIYKDIYPGVDVIFELPKEGGIKYRFEVAAGATIPQIAMRWGGEVSLSLDGKGNLQIKTPTTVLVDHAPSAETLENKNDVPVSYVLDGNVVSIKIASNDIDLSDGFIIDPWIYNTSYPAINRAHDIQEDAAGNIVVHGNHTNFQVQKFTAVGVLQWTYVSYSQFLGDIAVDDPGNVYIVGGYSAGKRQKLDPAGVQLWTFAGLVEEWRLAFNYSKTVLTIGGYFQDPGANNLALFDVNSGAISNEIIYGAETRAIATDCNGDMYSMHVTFGGTGVAASNLLKKTNANFTPAGSIQTGFLLAEFEAAAGYVPNPVYNPSVIYQGFNGLVVSGPYLYMTDGTTVKRVNKNSLAILNSTPLVGGVKLGNGGLAADLCGNIYAGSLNGIAKYDSLLNYIETIPTPGAVYDIIFGTTGELLVCGAGFIGSFAINCTTPPPIVASANNACDGTGSISINVAGGLAPYTYEWQPGGLTTNPISGLPAGVYTYTVNDAFCRTFIDSVEIYEIPTPTFTVSGVNTTNVNPNSVCLGEEVAFADNSIANDGTIVSWDWDFGDGNTSSVQNPTHTYATAGTFDVLLVVETSFGCLDSIPLQVTVDPLPSADFTVADECLGVSSDFVDGTTIASGTITAWSWDFGDGNTSSAQNPTHQFTTAATHTVDLTVTSANGCSASTQSSAVVFVLPQADFTYPTTCVNDPTNLLDASVAGDGTINSWQWDVEGSTLNGASVQHTFSAAGTFPVQLLVQDQFGCTDSITRQVIISVRPSMSVAVNDACAGTQFAFTNSSSIQSGTIASTHWDFGDGNTSNTVSPTNTYVNAGVYNVILYMESDLGCATDTTFQVEAYPNPVAGLQWQNQCDGAAITFTETTAVAAPGQLLASDWNMGDGTILNDTQVPNHLYAGFGDYSVQLSVETQHGCTDSENYLISVHAVPTADFSFTNICETDSVLFADQSTIPQGNITTWQWSFGNGQTFYGSNPGYQSYAADGTYPIQLTVTSDSGCVHVFDDVIEVYPTPIANFTFDSVCYPLAVQFTDLSDPNGSYAISQWAWAFSNGQSSQIQSPAIAFPQFGAYGATLTITNTAGCKDVISLGNALVHPLPVADYTANLQHCHLQTLIYTDQSTLPVLSNDQIVSWQYNFGDASTSNSPDGTHDYALAGFYNLELTIITNHGCEDAITKTVEVWPLPTVAFTADPQEGCDPLLVNLIDQSSIPAPYSIGSWRWNVGDESDDVLSPNPVHLYDPILALPHDSATYDVTLYVTSVNGCVDSLSQLELITVHPVPQAKFSTDPEKLASIVNPLFLFTDLSTENVSTWSWAFGDGQISSDQNPEHTYPDTGTYVITLIVNTDFGCTDRVSYIVKVEPYFSFYIPSAFTPNGDGRNESFFGAGEHLTEYNMQIFNRWGEMIFESNEQDFHWDGSYKGAQVEAGQYVYRFVVLDWDGNQHQYTGGVNLLR
ncbi:MAG: PKD domain-containing protein [Flavobacteriales bacterium]|nr:PKD domain-containing protein [Flavobacteriales bacterium]